ncbi:hypothetical protein Snoj_16560 [Streptomyces nojiriensis]|uniref:Uncharacterized protein n=1 Tax=Streptomyces nojiriensis TaxID=66374 RepID=A0ABQ3SHW5_9ACTN|nr:hypothetical protein GCM10010205_78630 [Streptomyces nojiriensis]GHI67738.1 hypothetical protein Snoj_16560 [Streptomyces nojiriensis]
MDTAIAVAAQTEIAVASLRRAGRRGLLRDMGLLAGKRKAQRPRLGDTSADTGCTRTATCSRTVTIFSVEARRSTVAPRRAGG